MANILVDRLFVEYVGKLNRASMGQVQGGFSQLGRSVNKTSRTMASGFQQSTILARRTAREVGLLVPLFATLGRVFYKTGSEVEFAFTKLRTQLGLTADETERAKKEMKGLAGETGRQWEELGRGYFSLRSAGVSESASMDTMAAAAKGAAIGLGDVQNIALLAAGALNSYGESNITATRAVEALLSTVKLGNIKDATVLAQQMPQLLPHGARLGVDFEELGAAMAAYTRTGADAARVATAIKRALSKTFTPTRQGIKLLEEFGLSTAMVRHDVKTKGWFRWLKEFTQVTLNSDPDLIRRYFQDQRALGFINDFIGKSDQYMWILERQYKAAGSIAEAMTVVDETGFHAVAQVWAKIKTTFANIYFVAVKPFLMAFNKLPSAIQQATLAMIAFGTATALAGRLMGFRGVGVWAGEMFRVGRILKNVAGTGMWGGGRRTEFHRDLIGQGGGLGAMVSLGMRKGRITKRWADHRRKSGAKAWAKKGGLSGWIGGSLFGTEASRSILNKAKDSKLAEKMKSIRAKALAQDHRDRAVEKRYHSTRANVKSARSNLTQADKGIAAMQARQAVLQSTTPRSKKKKRAHRRKVAKHKKLLTTAQQKRGVLTTQLTSAMAAADVARANRKGMAHEKYIAEKTERHDKKREKRNAKRERRRARYGKMGKIGGVLKGGAGRVGGFLGKIPGLGLLAGPLAALMTMMSPLVGMFASVAGSLLAMVVAVGAPILIIGGLLALLLIKSKSFRQLSVHTFGLIWDTLKFIYYWFKGRFRDLGRWMKRIFSDTPLGRWFGKATQWAGDLMADIAGWVIGIRKLLGLATEKEKLEQDKEAIAMLEAQGVDSSLRNQLLALEYTADEIIAFGKSLASADLDSILRGKNVGEAGVGNIMKNLRALLPPDDTGQPLTAADLESLLRDKDTEEDKVADVMKLFQTLGYDGGQPLTAADLESLLRDKDVGEDHWQRADLLIADIMKDIQELGHDPTQPLPAADLESILRRRQVEDDKVTDIMRTFRALGYDIIAQDFSAADLESLLKLANFEADAIADIMENVQGLDYDVISQIPTLLQKHGVNQAEAIAQTVANQARQEEYFRQFMASGMTEQMARVFEFELPQVNELAETTAQGLSSFADFANLFTQGRADLLEGRLTEGARSGYFEGFKHDRFRWDETHKALGGRTLRQFYLDYRITSEEMEKINAYGEALGVAPQSVTEEDGESPDFEGGLGADGEIGTKNYNFYYHNDMTVHSSDGVAVAGVVGDTVDEFVRTAVENADSREKQ